MKIGKKIHPINEAALTGNFIGYNLKSDMYNAMSDVIFKFQNDYGRQPTRAEIEDSIDFFTDKFFDKFSEEESTISEAIGDEKYYIGYTVETDNGYEDRIFKKLRNTNKLRIIVRELLDDDEKINSLGATSLYISRESDGKEYFYAVLDEDTGDWEVVLDLFSQGMDDVTPDEFKDNLFNRVYYSLTGDRPENLKRTSPSLYNSIISTDQSSYVDSEDGIGYFIDGEDVVIKARGDSPKITKWIKTVADHFGLKLDEIKKNNFRIRIEGGAKFFTDK